MSKLVSRIYYMSDDPDHRERALDLIKFVFTSVKYSKYLENVKHPVGQQYGDLRQQQ